MKILSLFFSGTGNTAWVTQQITEEFLKRGHEAVSCSIEKAEVKTVRDELEKQDLFIILHPAYGNYLPDILENYLLKLDALCSELNGIMGMSIDVPSLYSADGAAASEWFFKQNSMDYIGAYNIYLSCNFNTIVPGFKIAGAARSQRMLRKAKSKINTIIDNVENNVNIFEGQGRLSRFLGKLERQPNKKMMKGYELKFNKKNCIGCGKCINLCPANNLKFDESGKRVKTNGACTICMRCINNCPVFAIRFFNERSFKPFKQYGGIVE